MTTSAKTITIGGVSSTSKVDAMGKTENGKTGKSEIAQNRARLADERPHVGASRCATSPPRPACR